MIIIYKPNINSLPNKDATTLRFTRHVLSLMGEPEGDNPPGSVFTEGCHSPRQGVSLPKDATPPTREWECLYRRLPRRFASRDMCSP